MSAFSLFVLWVRKDGYDDNAKICCCWSSRIMDSSIIWINDVSLTSWWMLSMLRDFLALAVLLKEMIEKLEFAAKRSLKIK